MMYRTYPRDRVIRECLMVEVALRRARYWKSWKDYLRNLEWELE